MGANNVNPDFRELGEVVVEERALLEKFDGEVEDGIVVERVHVLNGVITKHEFLEDGEVVKTEHYQDGELVEQGGEDNRTN